MDQRKTDDQRQYFASMLVQLANDIGKDPKLFTTDYFLKTLDALREEYMKVYGVEVEPGEPVIDKDQKRTFFFGIIPKEEGEKLREQTRSMREEWD